VTITTPYTFVPFAPHMTSGQLWAHDAVGVDPTSAFDRPIPGLHTGYLDVTITALSGLYIGDASSTGTCFRWPGNRGRYAIPGASIRGMLRAHIAALTGASLGLGDRDDVFPTLRQPFSVGGQGAAAQNHNQAHTRYKNRRDSQEANPGRQRVGLLEADADGTWQVRETPQFLLPVRGAPRKMASARWPVVAADLIAGTVADARDQLLALRGTLVWVVWAQVSVDRVPRPVVIGLGASEDEALDNAWERAKTDNSLAEVKPLRARAVEFLHYLDERWQRSDDDLPCAMQMALLPTNLPNIGQDGRPKLADATPAANCYLVAMPTTKIPEGHAARTNPFPVSDAAKAEFTQLLDAERFDWSPPAPTSDQLKGWPTDQRPQCFPVFFDLDRAGTTVTHLGASNGFAVHTRHRLTQAVANGGGRWTRTLYDISADNDVTDNLFGAITATHQIRGRIEVGHATATTDLTALPGRYAPLFGPHLQSAATRLDTAAGHAGPPSFDDDHPTYRGRQFYWHRGDWDGTGETTWNLHVQQHNSLWDVQQDQHENHHEREELSPLPVGAAFRSRITFTNLSRSELGLLMFALHFAEPQDSNGPAVFAHKLGGGKPLGLGSVAVDADLSLITADRYLKPATGGIDGGVDPAPFIGAFLAAAGWDTSDGDGSWVRVENTGRAWPRHVAAWLLVHQWRRRPGPSLTRESTVSTFSTMEPSRDVFSIAGGLHR